MMMMYRLMTRMRKVTSMIRIIIVKTTMRIMMRMTRSMTKVIKFVDTNTKQEENLDKNTHKKNNQNNKKKKIKRNYENDKNDRKSLSDNDSQ